MSCPPAETATSALALERAPVVLKEEPLTRLLRVRRDGRDVLRKEYGTEPSLRWRSWHQPSRGLRELANLEAARAAGLPCVEPLAAGETRRRGCVRASWVETAFVEDCRTLEQVLEWMGAWPDDDPHAVRVQLARHFARLLRRLHAGGIVWSTCAYRNVLVRGRPCRLDLILCDLPWAARAGRAQAGRAAARVDVRDAFFSATSRRLFTHGERLAGLLAYCDGDRRAARRAWRALRARSGRRQMLEKNVVRAVYSYARPALLAAVGGRRVPRVRWSGELTISTQPGPRPASA